MEKPVAEITTFIENAQVWRRNHTDRIYIRQKRDKPDSYLAG